MTYRELMQMAKEVPLVELLELVPKDARLLVEHEDGYGTTSYPVGHLCHEAANALRDRLAQPDWIGLTDTEVIEISKATSVYGSDNHYEVMEFVASIEAKLKEKNA